MKTGVIILGGGQGTRLQSVVSDRPKPLAEVDSRPFVSYILEQLSAFGFSTACITTSHLSEKYLEILGRNHAGVELIYIDEDQPLGTGGAILNAARLLESSQYSNYLVLNGDSFLDINLFELLDYHKLKNGAGAVSYTHLTLPTNREV